MKSNLNDYFLKLEKILFFLIILFLPTQLGKHFWPDFSSIYSLRVDYLSPIVYFWDLLVLSLILTWLANSYLQKKLIINQKFLFLMLLFLLTQLISILTAINPEGSLVRLKDYLVALTPALYVASRSFIKIRKLLLTSLFISVIFTCLLALLQFSLGRDMGFWILGEREFSITTPLIARYSFYEHIFLRPYATFPHPNMLSAFLILTLPMVLYSIPQRLVPLKLFLGGLISATALITFSRASLILTSLQVALLYRRFWKILLILSVLIMPLFLVRFVSLLTFDTLAVLRREELSLYALNLFLDNPLAGIGLNNFINVIAADQVLIGTSRFLQPVHNIFLLNLSETGLLGTMGLSLLLFFAFWENLKKRDPFSKVLIGNLFMIIFLGLFDHYFLTLPQGQRLFFLVLGLSFMKRN